MTESEREELKQAAEAMRLSEEAGLVPDEQPYYWRGTLGAVVSLIRLARAQPAQEPVAWIEASDLATLHVNGSCEVWADRQCDIETNESSMVPLYASPPAQPVPEGWVLVPKVPRPDQINRMVAKFNTVNSSQYWKMAAVYSEALSAAPQPGAKDD